MATKKNTKTTSKETLKYEYTVDLTEATCPSDVYLAFANAKFNKYFNYAELVSAARTAINIVVAYESILDKLKAESKKKPNIFKRVWNWITRK